MKKVLISFMFLLMSQTLLFGQIVSTATGGNWSETTTWVGGVVPTANDNVIITGTTVNINNDQAECKDLTVEEDGYCYATESFVKIKVYGNLINKSSISGNNSSFTIEVYGDIISKVTASWGTSLYVELVGSSAQKITIEDFGSFFGFNSFIGLKSEITGSSYQWYRNGAILNEQLGFGFTTTEELRISDLDNTKPVGEYKCLVDGTYSRIITIEENSITPLSTLSGKVTNALDGTAISGALVEIAGLSTTTDESGNYEITDIPEATLNAAFSGTPLSGDAPLQVSFTDQSSDAAHTLVVSATGYSTYTNNQVVIAAGETLTMDVSLSPTLTEGEMRIVLNWGDAPNDLDSYLKTPTIDGSEYTIYYSSKGSATSVPYATLDHDDQDAYGPETITIYQKFAGTYKYYVHNYSGTPDIVTSNAVVQVYTNSGLVTSVNIPTTGSGHYWNVLTIDGTTGAISVINEIADTPPLAAPPMPEKETDFAQIALLEEGTQSITSWNWSFGDGATSTEQNPTHTYTSAGDYTVTLTVSNGTDNDIETKTNYISVAGGTTGAIVSTTIGGEWDKTTTWIGGVVPTATDDVVIDGTVTVNVFDAHCKNITINTGKTLTKGNDNITLYVEGDLLNNGIITEDNYGDLAFSVSGNVTNNGTWERGNIIFTGTNDNKIIMGAGKIINESEIMKVDPNSSLVIGSDAKFNNCRFWNDSYYPEIGDYTYYKLKIEDGSSYVLDLMNTSTLETVVFNGSGSVLQNVNLSSHFTTPLTLENVKLKGKTVVAGDSVFFKNSNVEIVDTLTKDNNNRTLYVEGDLLNSGIITENGYADLTISVSGNVTNNGVWDEIYATFTGTNDQTFTNTDSLFGGFSLYANVPSATTFQWFKDGTAISSATNELYEITPYDNPYGEYYCQTNAGNSRKITIKNENGGGESGVIIVENFDGAEFPPNGWTQTIQNTSNTWQQGNPSENTFTAIDPTNIYSAICPWVAQDQDEWLRTPVVFLPDDVITLNFYAGFSTDWLTSATLKLKISVDGGSNWTQVWEANNDGQGWKWREIELDLSNYKNNSNVVLAWQYVGNDGDLAGIDNVKLTYGTVGVEDEVIEVPTEFALNQNYPNPFNPTTVISYALSKQEHVTINIYNVLGEKIAELINEVQNAGLYKVNFNANNLASGAYIYRIQAGDFMQSRKMLLLK